MAPYDPRLAAPWGPSTDNRWMSKSGLYFLSAHSRHMLAEVCIHDTMGLTERRMGRCGGMWGGSHPRPQR